MTKEEIQQKLQELPDEIIIQMIRDKLYFIPTEHIPGGVIVDALAIATLDKISFSDLYQELKRRDSD